MSAETGDTAVADGASADIVNSAGDSALQKGILLGMTSAVAYSAANLALRGLSGRHDDLAWSVWVTATKALPTVVLASVLLVRRMIRHQPLFPIGRQLPGLFAAALLMQFGGNLGFQVALGHIGLAITVPLVFAFIILAGAILGRVYLGDAVSLRTVLAMLVMTVSIMLLSYAAWQNSVADGNTQSTEVDRIVWLGVLMAVLSGLSYGINGVVIRGLSRNALPIECMLIVYSTTGLFTLGVIGGNLLGSERLQQIAVDEWGMMLCAGVFNAIAFFSITHALKVMNISHVNVINASQNAMCAAAGILIFAEPGSAVMLAGIALSIVGLLTLDKKA